MTVENVSTKEYCQICNLLITSRTRILLDIQTKTIICSVSASVGVHLSLLIASRAISFMICLSSLQLLSIKCCVAAVKRPLYLTQVQYMCSGPKDYNKYAILRDCGV